MSRLRQKYKKLKRENEILKSLIIPYKNTGYGVDEFVTPRTYEIGRVLNEHDMPRCGDALMDYVDRDACRALGEGLFDEGLVEKTEKNEDGLIELRYRIRVLPFV